MNKKQEMQAQLAHEQIWRTIYVSPARKDIRLDVLKACRNHMSESVIIKVLTKMERQLGVTRTCITLPIAAMLDDALTQQYVGGRMMMFGKFIPNAYNRIRKMQKEDASFRIQR